MTICVEVTDAQAGLLVCFFLLLFSNRTLIRYSPHVFTQRPTALVQHFCSDNENVMKRVRGVCSICSVHLLLLLSILGQGWKLYLCNCKLCKCKTHWPVSCSSHHLSQRNLNWALFSLSSHQFGAHAGKLFQPFGPFFSALQLTVLLWHAAKCPSSNCSPVSSVVLSLQVCNILLFFSLTDLFF